MLTELFEPVGYSQAMARLQAMQHAVEKDKPYGLGTGDLYHILDCFHNIGLRGEDVFELGGNLPFDFLNECIKPNIWHSVTSDIYEIDYQFSPLETNRPGIQRLRSESINMYESSLGFEDYINEYKVHKSQIKFSRVFSVAAFEHLKLPITTLDLVYDICKENAKLFSYFTPVWSAPNGHHWSCFPENLPPYIHLQLSYNEFILWAQQSFGMSVSDIEHHAHQMYKSTRINRLTPSEWMNIFSNLKFKILVLNEIAKVDLGQLPEIDSTKVNNTLGGLDACSGYRIIAEKS